MFKNTKKFSSFSVDDLTKAKKFYSETLGLDTTETPEGLHLNLKDGAEIFIYLKPSHVPATFTVLNFLVDNVEQAVDGLAKVGIHMKHYDIPGGNSNAKGIYRSSHSPKAIAWFTDPAGNVLSVIEN